MCVCVLVLNIRIVCFFDNSCEFFPLLFYSFFFLIFWFYCCCLRYYGILVSFQGSWNTHIFTHNLSVCFLQQKLYIFFTFFRQLLQQFFFLTWNFLLNKLKFKILLQQKKSENEWLIDSNWTLLTPKIQFLLLLLLFWYFLLLPVISSNYVFFLLLSSFINSFCFCF